MTETEAALREALTNWMRLYAGARRPKSDSNTAFVDIRDLEAYAASTRAALALPSEGGWRDIASASCLDRVFVAGWQKPSGTCAGYWWYEEDMTDEHSVPITHPEALLWHPIPPPPNRDGPLPASPTTRSDTDAN